MVRAMGHFLWRFSPAPPSGIGLGMPRPFAPVEAPPLLEQDGRTFVRIVELMQRLLAPDGCPWDREQSFESLRKYVLEEACEVIDAIDDGDREEIAGELGDLLLQVVFQAELGRSEGAFGIDDVVAKICEKLVRRHPHVFADGTASDADEVITNWERIKAQERKNRDGGVLAGVPRSLPSLTRAQRMGEKVARVGFDWQNAEGSLKKVEEELGELRELLTPASDDKARVSEELGDLLFATVNLARHLDIDAEGALRQASDKFARRFRFVEEKVHAVHGGWPGPGAPVLPLETLDAYWEQAKQKP